MQQTATAIAPAPGSATIIAERRRHPRHLIEAQIMVLFPEFWLAEDADDLCGWTINLSENGVCFSLPALIPNRELILHIDYEGMGAEYVQVRVVDVRQSADGGWRYHAAIERPLSSINALDCLS
jgi:hypothetical protein